MVNETDQGKIESWLTYLKRGLSRKLPQDRISGQEGVAGAKTDLKNLKPFVARHWRKGALGILLILFTALFAFPQPLIFRYLVDRVLLDRQLVLLAGAIILLVIIGLLERLATLLQQFVFTRFEQTVLLDIQRKLLDRTLHFPKSFFDNKEVGYLMSRLLSDVQGLRWFFSSTLVYIATNILRFVGGVVLLFFLEWRLALAALVILPGLVLCVRYSAGKSRILSHHGMEQQAQVSRQMQESLSATAADQGLWLRGTRSGPHHVPAARRLPDRPGAVDRQSVAGLAINTLGDLARLVVLVAPGAYLVITGDWTLGSLLAFQSYLGYVYGPAQFLATANLQLQTALAALERVSTLFDIVPEETVGSGTPVERLTGEVEFKNVSFSYDGREIGAGECVVPGPARRTHGHRGAQRRRQDDSGQPPVAFLQAHRGRDLVRRPAGLAVRSRTPCAGASVTCRRARCS